jgi:transcriptional regulator with XRE-family HTH domain
MDQAAAPVAPIAPFGPFGRLLRHWRMQRHCSQLALALQAEVSARHLSWLETGKAQPSRAMVLRLAEQLDVPLRERNTLLTAAGYAPLYGEKPLSDPSFASVRGALQRLLDAHEPWPALAVDRHWHLVAHNRLLPLLMASASPTLLQPPINVLRLSLHPQGLAPMVVNLPAWRAHVLARLQRQIIATGDAELVRLLAELRALPMPPDTAPAQAFGPLHDVAVPLTLHSPLGVLNFITTITVFGAPNDVTLAELAVETLLPADAETAAALRQLHASLA